MDEYIERTNLIARIRYYLEHTPEDQGEHYAYSVALKEVLSRPAADVAPVKHARWVGDTCSRCGFIMSQKTRKYCPNCGAKMN